jgi:uncharacterized protein (DUF2249 family)
MQTTIFPCESIFIWYEDLNGPSTLYKDIQRRLSTKSANSSGAETCRQTENNDFHYMLSV